MAHRPHALPPPQRVAQRATAAGPIGRPRLLSTASAPRRGPGTALAVTTLAGLAQIDAGAWDGVAPAAGAALTHGYLTAWENVELRGLRSRPLVARAPDRADPVAACPGYFYDLDLATVRSPGGTPVVEAIRRCRRSFLFSRVYELGSPTPLTEPFLVPDARLLPFAVDALVRAAVEEARRDGAALTLVQNFTADDATAQSQLARRGFARVPMPPTAVLEVSHGSFGGYLAAMRAPYRRRARQALRRSSGLRVERIEDFADLADELARLWRCVFERAREVKRELLTPAFFRAVSRLDEVSVVAPRRRNGSIASYALLLEDGPRLRFLYCGFEAEAGRADGAYFRLLYEIVRTGIEGGFHSIDFGMTTLAPKLDVGAVPVQLYAWVRHGNPAVQRLIRLLANGPLRPRPVPSRRVFKAAAPG